MRPISTDSLSNVAARAHCATWIARGLHCVRPRVVRQVRRGARFRKFRYAS